MKPKEALKKLNNLVRKTKRNHVDLEEPHVEADMILTDLIQELLREKKQKDLGKNITESFNKIKKWYA